MADTLVGLQADLAGLQKEYKATWDKPRQGHLREHLTRCMAGVRAQIAALQGVTL